MQSGFTTNCPSRLNGHDSSTAHERLSSLWGHWIGAVLLLVVFALPGLAPVLRLLDTGSGEVAFQANYIQIYYRLGHHLDPKQFSIVSYTCYLDLLIFWILSCRCQRVIMFNRGRRVIAWYLAGTLVIALAGFAIGLGPKDMLHAFRLNLMKFYPFRMFDVTLPIAASLALLACWLHLNRARSGSGQSVAGGWTSWLLFGSMLIAAVSVSASRQHVSRMSVSQRKDWMDACHWISQNTAPGAVFLTHKSSWAFKWYAHRAEYVSFKDCPQDAAGVVEWKRRLQYQKQWAKENFGNGYSVDELRELQKRTGITHIISPFRRFWRFEAPQVFQNGSYQVLQLAE